MNRVGGIFRMRVVACGLAALLLWPLCSLAHPLGQNAYNREAAILVEADGVSVDYLLDLAEVPTLAVGEEADSDRDGKISDAEWTGYAARWAGALPEQLVLDIDGKPTALTLRSQSWRISPGQSGLSTLRLLARLHAPLSLTAQNSVRLDYHDQTRVNRLGWKEIWITAANGARIAATDVPREDRSKTLTDFTPRAEGPPALLDAHAEIAYAAAGTIDKQANAEALAAAEIQIAARAGAAKPVSTDETSPIWSFFKLGMHHIATGWDHLMFLLGLVLLSSNLRRLTFTVTAFTVAHSVTLGLAAFGYVHPPGNWVEALIAATIAYVGLVALSGRKNNHGPLLAFSFGLIHGFGFAGALSESLGASNSLRLTGLVSFNLGIEAFQLSLVCLIVPVLQALRRTSIDNAVHTLLASFVFVAGAVWFLLRTVGKSLPAEVGIAAVVLAVVAFLVVSARRRGPHNIAMS